MIDDITTATLGECLSEFRERFNTNPRLMKHLVGWDRDVLVEPLDGATAYTLTIANLEMTGVTPGINRGDDMVLLQAGEETLKRIFTGDCNPAAALADGNMALFSTPLDREKLKTIAIIIWGL